MRGVLEKSDLLRVAKAHQQLWECRRLCLCGNLAQKDPAQQLYSAVCVFRIDLGPTQDMMAAVRAAKDGLKRTRQRMVLLVHPDKASNELSEHKAVFDDAFKVLTNAYDTLTAAAEGRYEGGTAGPGQQQQAGAGFGFAAGGPGFAGFGPGGFPWGFAGFPPGYGYGSPGGAYWQAT
jgi:hypothetical protein